MLEIHERPAQTKFYSTGDALRPKPPVPPKPKLKAAVDSSVSCAPKHGDSDTEKGSTDLRNDLNEDPVESTRDEELPKNAYPCICEHLNIEVRVPTPSECRTFFLKKSLEDSDLHMRYHDT